MPSPKIILAKLQERAFAPVDIASLVFFRIAFGLLMIWQVCRHFMHDRIASYWLEPRILFKFYGFSWIHPWPGNWLYIHMAALGLFALFVSAGFFYRISATLMFLSYAYFFLLDEARYVNHTYLLCLFSFLLIFIPAHRAFSVDAWLNPKIRSQTTSAWTLWLLRLQIGVVYFFAGLAKITPDWLQGEPMRLRMAHRTDFPLLGRFFREEWAVYGISYSGLLLDLFIVPLLFWRRTRAAAFCLAIVFHLMNAIWFSIGVFPWLAVAATALFFSPSWPRRILQLFHLLRPYAPPASWKLPLPRRQVATLTFVTIYATIQLLLPLRHLLWQGGIEWSDAEHRFSWRMMLTSQYSRSAFYITDPNTGKTRQTGTKLFLDARQSAALAFLPDFPLQFAHYLATVMPRKGPKPLIVEARIWRAINGRKPELYINPNVNLAAERRTLGRPPWLLESREPLPPLGQRYVDQPFGPVRADE